MIGLKKNKADFINSYFVEVSHPRGGNIVCNFVYDIIIEENKDNK